LKSRSRNTSEHKSGKDEVSPYGASWHCQAEPHSSEKFSK
jgi:hypothetical protein